MSAPSSSRCSRRDFAQSLACGLGIGATAGLTHAPMALAQDPDKDKPRLPTATELVLTLLVQQYPSEHYADEVLEGIAGDIRVDLARGRELSKFALQNSDEPASVFAIYRSDRPHGEGPAR